MSADRLDLLLIHPGGRERVYQDLSRDLAAIEPPLWCRLIAGYARDRGWSVAILDSQAEGMGPEAIGERVRETNPRLVGMVVMGHQPSASTQSMVGAREACEAIRAAAPDVPVLMTGGHPSSLPERTLREEPVDWVCDGEGPVTFQGVLEGLKAGGFDPAAVPGLVWRDGAGDITVNPKAPLLMDLDKDLHGEVWDLLPMDRYRAHNWQCFGDLSSRMPYASIYTSLGCPFKCSFCCINAPFGVNRYRMRSPERVVAEIKHLHDTYGVKTFKIIDEMFVLNDKHVNRICDLLIEADLGLNIWAYARVDTVKPEFLEKLRKAGIIWLALGIESGSKHVRDGADKALRNDDIKAIVRMIQDAGLYVIGNYIVGLPDDDMDSMRETLDLALELNCEFHNIYSAMAYPGSKLYDMAVENGWPLPDSWSGYSQHSFDCKPLPTEKLSAAQVLKFRDDAFHALFSHEPYLDHVEKLFGAETRRHIEEMAAYRLPRKLVEEAGL